MPKANNFPRVQTRENHVEPVPRRIRAIRNLVVASQDEFRPENYSTDFDAIEILTGSRLEDVHTFRAPDPLPASSPRRSLFC